MYSTSHRKFTLPGTEMSVGRFVTIARVLLELTKWSQVKNVQAVICYRFLIQDKR